MKKCPKCEHEWADDVRFCTHCMTSLNEKKKIKKLRVFRKRGIYAAVALILCGAITAGTVAVLRRPAPNGSGVGAGQTADNGILAYSIPSEAPLPHLLPGEQGDSRAQAAILPLSGKSERLSNVPEGYVGIYTKEDLNNVRNDLAGNYILMNDIVFEKADFAYGGPFYENGAGFNPIGTDEENAFTGTFNGNGYEIKNLYVRSSEAQNVGLFGYLKNATVQNLRITDADIQSLYTGTEHFSLKDCLHEYGRHAITEDGTLLQAPTFGNGRWIYEWTDPETNVGTPMGAYLEESRIGSLFGWPVAYVASIQAVYEDLPTTYAAIGDMNRIHPGYMTNTAVTFIAPYTGTVSFHASLFSYHTNNSANDELSGTSAYLYVNETRVWPETEEASIFYYDTSNEDDPFEVAVPSLEVKRGDKVRMIIAPRIGASYTCKGCRIVDQPSVTYLSGVPTPVSFTGAIAGCSDGSRIVNCASSGTVRAIGEGASAYTGGLIGYVKGATSSVFGCYNTADVSASVTAEEDGFALVGGITGYCDGAICNAYNAGAVHADSSHNAYLGGIAGSVRNNGAVGNVYNRAEIKPDTENTEGAVRYVGEILGTATKATVKNCYHWDRSKTAIGNEPDNGTPLTEEQFRQQASFVGFDFDTVWQIDAQTAFPYPVLRGMTNPTENALRCISVQVPPTKTSYEIQLETLDLSGGILLLSYADGTIETVDMSEAETSGFSNEALGTVAVTLTYGGRSVDLPVIIEPPKHLREVPEGYVGVYTKEDLDNVRKNLSKNYILMNDIVFDDADFEQGGAFFRDGAGWQPIGTSESKPFNGIFEGNGYEIRNLKITANGEYPLGLFGVTGKAKIFNLAVTDTDIRLENAVDGAMAGGIVGLTNGSDLNGCAHSGSIRLTNGTGEAHVGGIAGFMNHFSTLRNSRNSGTLTASSPNPDATAYLGGITGGILILSEIDRCVNEATVTVENYFNACAGGFAGYVQKASVAESRNTGAVKAVGTAEAYAGGICAKTSAEYDHETSTFTRCHNAAPITATTESSVTANSAFAGGILGGAVRTETEGGQRYISLCYNTGEILAKSAKTALADRAFAGGLAGASLCKGETYCLEITYSYNVGTVRAQSGANDSADCASAGAIAGGLADRSVVENCYYLDTSAPAAFGSGEFSATKCTDQQMREFKTFTEFNPLKWTIDGDPDYPYPELTDLLDLQ